MSDLPSGWEWATLGDIAEWGSGGTPRAGTQMYYGGSIPWAVIGDLNDSLVQKTANKITQRGLDESSAKLVTPGSILIAMYGSIGKLGISGVDMATNQAIAFAQPKGIEPRYLFWYLMSQRSQLKGVGKGATQKNISQTILRSWPIPVAPVPEQRHIVAALEDHLSRLDAAARYLASARGRITTLIGAMRNAEIGGPSDNNYGYLADVLDRIEAGKSFGSSARPATEDEWGIIKVSAMTWGEFRPSENKFVPDDGRVDPRYEIRPGDILVSRANTEQYVGAPVLVRSTRPKLLLSDKSLRLVPKSGVNRDWLIEVLASPQVRKQISHRATGTKDSMRNISQASLKEVRIPLHESDRQGDVAAELAERREAVHRLDSELTTATVLELKLRRSLLADAFAGRLVPQEPNDESASVLLERVRAERAGHAKLKRTRRPKQHSSTQEPLL